jgi:long-chain acyl-CoA synthetase
MFVKRGQNYHTVPVTQVQPRLFDSSWKTVLAQGGSNPAIYGGDGSVLRNFQDIESERAAWREKLAAFATGDCVVCALGNDPSFPALMLASWDKGLVVTPVEPGLPGSQLDGILELTRAQGLVSADGILRFQREPIAWEHPRPDMLKLTSGTTGTPRAIRVRETHLFADCRNICATMSISPGDANYGVIPFSHSYGFSNLITPLLFHGTRLVCATDPMPRAIYESLQRSRATVFPGTPTLFQAVGSLADAAELRSVRLCISAGAPLVPEISRQFCRKYGLKIHSFYGSSECGGIAYDRTDETELPSGFAGRPMDGVRLVRIGNDRIAVEGENVADGYFPYPEEAILNGKRFVPGDIVEWSDSGMRLIGRVTDIVNVAGKKVHPAIVEEHLRKLPGVIEAVVFGIPSAIRNEDLVAFVTCSPAVSRQLLESHCRSGLSSWQIPREFQILSEMPVNTRGKINRAELAKSYMQSRAQSGDR